MYGLTLVSGLTAEPVTLAEAREHTRVELGADDSKLAALLIAARQYVERVTGQSLATQTFDLTLEEFPSGNSAILLPRWPVQSITSVQYVDGAGVTQTWSAANYQLDAAIAPAQLVPAYGNTWPSTRVQRTAVTVRFVAGYSATNPLPEELRLAVLLLVGHWYENREAVNIGNIVTAIPFTVDTLLANFRLQWFGLCAQDD